MMRATSNSALAETTYSVWIAPNDVVARAAIPVKSEALIVCHRQALPLAEATCMT